MSLILYSFQCAGCSTVFLAPGVSGDYGEFVMRSLRTRQPAYLNAIHDSVYSEVDELLEELGAYQGKKLLQRAEILQGIFGLACDSARDGSELRIGIMPRCPACSSDKMASWSPAEPVQA